MDGRFSDYIAIGRVVKPQGRKGEVLVEPLSDRPGRFPGLRRVFLPGPAETPREVAVDDVWPHKGRFVVKLAGIDSIDAAETLRGLDFRIPEEELEKLPEGSYYHHQLKGLEVEDEKGGPIGVVMGILEAGGEAPVLEIRGPGGELLLPLAEPFVRKVDLQGGRLVVVRPETMEVGASTGRVR
jgi:16S rRNA processing protein RimM